MLKNCRIRFKHTCNDDTGIARRKTAKTSVSYFHMYIFNLVVTVSSCQQIMTCNDETENLHVKIRYTSFCCLLRLIPVSSLQVC